MQVMLAVFASVILIGCTTKYDLKPDPDLEQQPHYGLCTEN